MVASRAPALVGGTVIGRYAIVRELGSRAVPTYAARETRAGHAAEPAPGVVVIERLPCNFAREHAVARDSGRLGAEDAGDGATLVALGKRLATLAHPNLVRFLEVDVVGGEVIAASELADAERYDVLTTAAAAAGRAMPLVVHLRVLVDVLGGLSALHLLRDARNGPLDLVHGEVCPANVLLGADGNAKIAHLFRVPGVRGTRDALGYLAPEVRLDDKGTDARADVYSCGVMLWEALNGKRLFAEDHDAKILPRQLADRIEMAALPADTPWAAPLAEVCARALAADPKARFATAAEMAAALRRVAGAKLALKSTLASLVKDVCGDAIADRRRALAVGAAASAAVRKALTVPTPAVAIPKEVLERALVDAEEPTAKMPPAKLPAVAAPPMQRAPAVKPAKPPPPLPRKAPATKPPARTEDAAKPAPSVERAPAVEVEVDTSFDAEETTRRTAVSVPPPPLDPAAHQAEIGLAKVEVAEEARPAEAHPDAAAGAPLAPPQVTASITLSAPRRRRAVALVLGAALLLVAYAGARVAMREPRAENDENRAKPPGTATGGAALVTVTSAATTATATASTAPLDPPRAPAPSVAASPSGAPAETDTQDGPSSASPSPPAGNGAPSAPRPRPTPRPKGTYDPLGI